jgi:hypothetical protein
MFIDSQHRTNQWRAILINLTACEQAAKVQGMKTSVSPETAPMSTVAPVEPRVPVWLKRAFTAFTMALVPVYWAN